jgi:hypothetical protein
VSALEQAGALALAEIKRLHAFDVIDPKVDDASTHAIESRGIISQIFLRGGLRRSAPYRGINQTERPAWCAATAIACWRAAGLDVSDAEAAVFGISTYRLVTWARYENWSEPGRGVVLPLNRAKPTDQTDRRKLLRLTPGNVERVTPGDIAIVGAMQHVVIADRWDAARRVLCAYSGNGYGVGPNGGAKRFGIVYAEYAFGGKGAPLWALGPAFADLLAERG